MPNPKTNAGPGGPRRSRKELINKLQAKGKTIKKLRGRAGGKDDEEEELPSFGYTETGRTNLSKAYGKSNLKSSPFGAGGGRAEGRIYTGQKKKAGGGGKPVKIKPSKVRPRKLRSSKS